MDDYLWNGYRWVHKPRGRTCDWTMTPQITDRFTDVLVLIQLHEENGCG